MEVAGPLGTPLGLAQRKRASPRGEAGTSGFLCVSDSDRRLKEISPGISLEGMMLMLKLQYFSHLLRRVDSLVESITMNKASGGDGISVELFQILKDDAVKVLHSISQQIWKAQHRVWPGGGTSAEAASQQRYRNRCRPFGFSLRGYGGTADRLCTP